MKKLSIVVTGIVMGILLLTLPALAAKDSPVKIGTINTKKILMESKAAKAAQKVFMKDLEAKRSIYQAKEKEIRLMEEELKAPDQKMTQEERSNKTAKLSQEVKEFKRMGADMDEELKQKEADLTRKLLGDVAKIVKSFSEKENYTVILEKGSVIISDDSIDITDRIIKIYDASKK